MKKNAPSTSLPQNLMELWVVATRLVEWNGLGVSVADVLVEFARLKSFFIVIPGTEDIFPAWERLVAAYQVAGKSAHDATLVAAMQVDGIKDILTFDRTGFTRYAGIEVVHPAGVIASAT